MARRTNTSLIAAFIIALVVLMALCGYLFYDRTQLSSEVDRLGNEMIQAERVQTELQIEYEEAIASLDEMGSNNEALETLISQQKDELKTQKNRINNLIWKERKLKEAQAEIATIKELAEKYIVELTDLKAKNEQLSSANQELTVERDYLNTNLETVRDSTNTLLSQNEVLENVTQNLSKKVDLASVIKSSNVVVTGYKQKKNGEYGKRAGAKNIDKIEICFQVERNLVAEKGEESFYIRIIDPIGETLAIESLGSGVFVNEATKEPTRFTTSGRINYDNEAKQACISWMPGTAFQKGNYTVEVYNKGYLSSSGSFQLK